MYLSEMNKLKHSPKFLLLISRILIFCCCFLTYNSFAIDIFEDEDLLWKSGENLYIKLDDQDKKGIPNDHPVTIDSKSITNALMSIEYAEGSNAAEETTRVFAVSQANLLGNYLSTGLAKAKPDQDIIFALATNKVLALGVLRDKVFMAGRAFYKDGRLNIIIGDYDRPIDRGMEAVSGGAGVTEVKYFFDNGRRNKASGFKKTIITGDGIDTFLADNRKRRDWLVIDVPAASQAYLARLEALRTGNQGTNMEAIEAESARLAKERREMRMEMARMRKEMQELSEAGGDIDTQTVEERIAVLDELLEKKLITPEEYERKRQEILDDI